MDKLAQHFVQGTHEDFFWSVRILSFPFENPAPSPIRALSYLSTGVSRSLKTGQRLAWISPCSNVSENKKHRMWRHSLRASEKSGEVNRPVSVVSYTSDASKVVARSSTFVSRLPLLESKVIEVCSLLTSMRDLGSQPVGRDCSASRPKQNPPGRGAVDGLIDGYSSEGEADEPSASVRKDVKMETTVGQARCGETSMRCVCHFSKNFLHSSHVPALCAMRIIESWKHKSVLCSKNLSSSLESDSCCHQHRPGPHA